MKTNNDEVAIEDLTENLILKVPRVSFGYKKNTIRIAYYTLITLGLPLYIRFLVNKETKQFAVQASGKDDLTALKVDYFNQSEVRMRHVSSLLVHQLFEMNGWNKIALDKIQVPFTSVSSRICINNEVNKIEILMGGFRY